MFYGAHYEREGRGELLSFAAQDPAALRVLIPAEDGQSFGEPSWRSSADAFDIVRELDGQFSIERVTTEWISVETRVELGELRVANRRLYRSPSGEQLYLLTSDDTRKHLSRVDPQGEMSEVVDLALFGITAPEYCQLSVLTENRVSIDCLGAGGNSALVTLVETNTGMFDTYWTEMAGEVGVVMWAPDGRAFAYCVGDSGADPEYRTWLVELAKDAALASNVAVELGVGCPHAWSPDSTRLVTNSQIFNLDAEDPSVAERELQAGEFTKRGLGDPSLTRFSSDGARLAYGQGSAHLLLFEQDRDLHYKEYAQGTVEAPPVWSADGAELYRGYCGPEGTTGQWSCRGEVYFVDELLDDCLAQGSVYAEGAGACGLEAPGLNAASSVPAPAL